MGSDGKMKIYYSGEGHHGNPEIVLGDRANVMLTFYKSHPNIERRFRRIWKKRMKGRKNESRT